METAIKSLRITFTVDRITSGFVKEISIHQIYNQKINYNLWRIDPDFSLDEFRNNISLIETSGNVYKRATLSLSGSNFYNGLIEITNLFDAELAINYEKMYISFKNKGNRKYKGYKLNPNVNIKDFSRSASSEELYTVIDVYGGTVNDTPVNLIPTMPMAFKQYFWDCINHNFEGDEWFPYFSPGGYTVLVQQVLGNPDKGYLTEEQYNTQKPELLEYASILDQVPNFENRIYDISYFYYTGKISENNYQYFQRRVQDDLRKLNIKINLYSEQYYNLLSAVSMLMSEVEFLTENIVTEEQYYNTLNIRLKEYQEKRTTDKVTETEWKIKDMIATSISTIDKYREQLYLALGITNQTLNFSSEYLIYNLLQLYGYKSHTNNCFTKIINEINNNIQDQQETYQENKERLEQIAKELETTTSEYQKQNLEVEQAGLERNQLNIEKAIGRSSSEEYDSHEGYLILRRDAIQTLFNMYQSYYTEPIIGYEDYLINYYSGVNLVYEKDQVLQDLYSNFEDYLIEGYYENSDEVNSIDLAEQALLIKQQMTYPTITYNVGIIDLSDLENYKFLKIQIGDKIKIDDKDLFLEYNPNYQEYITITGIDYTLREPENTKLEINKQDEDNRLIQKLFLNLSVGE